MGVHLGRRTLHRGLLIHVQPAGRLLRLQWLRQGCRVKRGCGHDEGVLLSGYAAAFPAAAPGRQPIKELPVACTRELSMDWDGWR
jgi:hypothetical protein